MGRGEETGSLSYSKMNAFSARPRTSTSVFPLSTDFKKIGPDPEVDPADPGLLKSGRNKVYKKITMIKSEGEINLKHSRVVWDSFSCLLIVNSRYIKVRPREHSYREKSGARLKT